MKNKHKFFKGIFLCLFISFSALAQEEVPQGMKFFEGNWSAALAEAKTQKKLLFVDIYTTWCGPCKQMSKNIFPLQDVGDKFNAHFVNYKIDAEKGEGIEIAKKFRVEAYPTYLFVSAEGLLVYKSLGSMPAEKFIAEADKAIAASKEEKTLAAWDDEYKTGKREADFLAGYMDKRKSTQLDNSNLLEEYLNAVPEAEQGSDKNLKIIIDNIKNIEGKAFEILIKNIVKANEMYKTNTKEGYKVNSVINNSIRKTAFKAIQEGNKPLLEKANAASKEWSGMSAEYVEKTTTDNWLFFYQKANDFANYRAIALAYEKKFLKDSKEELAKKDLQSLDIFMRMYKMGMKDSTKEEDFIDTKQRMATVYSRTNAGKYNAFAWVFYKNTDTKKEIKQALAWSKKAIYLAQVSSYYDTQARLLYKINKKKDAIKSIEKAYELVKKEKKDDEASIKRMAVIVEKIKNNTLTVAD